MKKSRMPWKTLAILSEMPSETCALSPPMIAQRQQQPGEDHADGIEPAEEGDDDGDEAVVRRIGRLQLARDAHDVAGAGKAREAAREQEAEEHRALGGEAGEAPGPRRAAKHPQSRSP